MNEYVKYLSELIPEKDSLKIVKTESKKFYKEHTSKECYEMYPILYQSDNFQIQEIGVFLAGYIADEYPELAIALLSSHKDDESEYVRKSAGNCLRDISKKFPELIQKELQKWDLSSKSVVQVYKLASKFLSIK